MDKLFIIRNGLKCMETRFEQRSLRSIMISVSSSTESVSSKSDNIQISSCTVHDYEEQVKHVLEKYQKHTYHPCLLWQRPAPSRLIVRWMGGSLCNQTHIDPLANLYFVKDFSVLCERLERLARSYHLEFAPRVCTVLPRITEDMPLANIFHGRTVRLYYQLYSLSPIFRQHFLPHAQDWRAGLSRLKQYQQSLGYTAKSAIVFQWPFWKEVNDDVSTVTHMSNVLKSMDFADGSFEACEHDVNVDMNHLTLASVDRQKQLIIILNEAFL